MVISELAPVAPYTPDIALTDVAERLGAFVVPVPRQPIERHELLKTEAKEPRCLEPEAFYDTYEPQLHKHAQRLINRHLATFDTPGEFKAMREREWSFYSKIYRAAMDMADGHTGEVHLLFDVDQTLTEGSGSQRLVRPAFAWVLNELQERLGGRLRVGLLTTLPSKGNDVYERCMENVHPALEEAGYMISTSEYVVDHPEVVDGPQTIEEADAAGLTSLATLEVIAATKARRMTVPQWRDPYGKMEILLELLERTRAADTHFVFADNFSSTSTIRGDHPRLRALYMGEEVHCPTMRLAAERQMKKLSALVAPQPAAVS